MKPEIPEVTVTGTEIARVPGASTAARNPRSPGAMIFSSAIGSPAATGFRTTHRASHAVPPARTIARVKRSRTRARISASGDVGRHDDGQPGPRDRDAIGHRD